jgi:hypothetical protein
MKRTAAIAITAALALLSCGGPEGVSPGPDLYMPAPTSPKIVLYNVMAAFDARHIKILKASLSDDFTFYFKAEDVGARVNGYVIPGVPMCHGDFVLRDPGPGPQRKYVPRGGGLREAEGIRGLV